MRPASDAPQRRHADSRPSGAPRLRRAPLFSAAALRRRVRALAAELAAERDPRPLALIGILRGSFIFLADLVRELHRCGLDPRIDFMTLSSYGAGTRSSGRVRLVKDFTMDVRGARVVVVDDILDTGRTLRFARRHVRARGAARVKLCALLDKPSRRVFPCVADWVGFRIPDAFVVGYGLDYDGRYRSLPHITTVIAPPDAEGQAASGRQISSGRNPSRSAKT